jgi:two-component system response regulator
MASPQNATEQTLIPLLVFKTLLDPLLRQHLSGNDDTVLQPQRLLRHLNNELCHSRIRAAFDVWVGVLDTADKQWCWAQAGDMIRSEPQAKPDLALGIWQQARYQCRELEQVSKIHARLPQQAELIIQRETPQTAE